MRQDFKGQSSNEVVINGGGLADVIVYIANPEEKQGFQESCKRSSWMSLHAKSIRCNGQAKDEIVNSDVSQHSPGNASTSRCYARHEIEEEIQEGERFLRSNDVHPWMQAYAGVFGHPFFSVTDKNGKFSIDGVPDGSTTLLLGTQRLARRKASWSEGNGSATSTSKSRVT